MHQICKGASVNKVMKEVRVIGSRKMLDMPAGTIFIPIEYDALHDISQFLTSGPINLNNYISELHIYGDNSGSASLNIDFRRSLDIDSKGSEADYFYYDYNVVGDAFPSNTIYIILTDEDIPASVTTFVVGFKEPDKHLDNVSNIFRKYDDNSKYWEYYRIVSKEKFLQIREDFLNENFPDRSVSTRYFDNWARKCLDEDTENQYILNLDTKMEIIDE